LPHALRRAEFFFDDDDDVDETLGVGGAPAEKRRKIISQNYYKQKYSKTMLIVSLRSFVALSTPLLHGTSKLVFFNSFILSGF
jgi:hypothetical protein